MNFHFRRPSGLPEAMRRQIRRARRSHLLSQEVLGERLDVPQAHVSLIETGRGLPRVETLLDLARLLDHELVLVPRSLAPAVAALIEQGSAPEEDEG
jgi:transcriptional regulator with XRE-family HTH domain